jgi:hypothetical protein
MLFRRMAPVFGMRPDAAIAYLPPLRKAFGIEMADAGTASIATAALMSNSVANCVGFVKALRALEYCPCDEGRGSEAFAGANALQALEFIFRRDPHETLKDRAEFVILTNPTEAELRIGTGDVQGIAARFVSPVERPSRSSLRGAKILKASGLASIVLALRDLDQTGNALDNTFGFEGQVLQ